MPKHALPKTLFAAILGCASLLASAQAAPGHAASDADRSGTQRTKYWTGGDGDWSDGTRWSLTVGGPGGAGVPRANEHVVIAPRTAATIRIDGTAWCKDLEVDGARAQVGVRGTPSTELTIGGNWRMAGRVVWGPSGEVRLAVRREGVELDLRGIPVHADVVLDGSGAWSLTSDLRLAPGKNMTLRQGTLIGNGNLLAARALLAEGRGSKRVVAGASTIMLDEAPGPALRALVDPGNSILVVGGDAFPWGIAKDSGDEGRDRDVNVCGTAPGQTSFVVDARLVSDYNGFGVRCRGECNATVTVTVSGGIGPFTYQWLNGGPNTATWTTACGGPQIVIVTDVGQGISCPVSVNVTEPAPLGVIFFGPGTRPTCPTVCDGSRTALGVGGVPPISYDWNNGAGTGSSFTQLCPGSNTLSVYDANGCRFDTTFFFDLRPLEANLQTTGTSCFGECDGSAVVTPDGGTAPHTILWTPAPPVGQGTPNAGGLCAGEWSVTITDANGCDTTVVFTIDQPPALVVDPVWTDASCHGLCDGAATVTPSGTQGPFSFQWTPTPGSGQGSGTVVGLCAGTYTVRITDTPSGCDTLITIVITEPPAFDVREILADATCSDGCDGGILINVSGGVPGYTFLWSPVPGSGQGTPEVSLLCAGDWSVTITDAAGCDTTITYTIGAPPPLEPSPFSTDATCPGVCDGTAGAPVTGGTPPYTYLWTPAPSGGQGTDQASGLCAGTWTLRITDLYGCDTLITFEINEPPPLQADPAQTDVTCRGLCDGTASVDVSGGTPGYTFTWSPAPGSGQGTPTAGGLCPGNYSVLVRDANGCETTVPFTIAAAVPIEVVAQVVDATCPGRCDGSLGVVASGGTAPYTYTWSPVPGAGQGTPNASGFCAGNVTLTVRDALGCDTTIVLTIDEPAPIEANGTVTNVSCAGECDGGITLAPSGGTGSFTYRWSPVPPSGQGTQNVSGLCAGPWSVTIASGGCDTTLVFEVIEPPALDASLAVTDATCSNTCDGSATVAASGGTAPYSYNWTPAPTTGQGTPTASGLCAGNWSVTVADANGCDTTLVFQIVEPTPIVADLVLTPAGCDSLCAGTASVTVSGGTGPYTYLWGPGTTAGQGTPNATGLCPGVHSLVITDAAGCDTTILFIIASPAGIEVVPTVTPVSCGNRCDGTIGVTATGGVAPYAYTWSPVPPTGQGTPNVSGLCPGIWTLLVRDAVACDTALIMVVTGPPPIAPNGTWTDETCNGPCDGTASVNPSGGVGPYTYVWTPAPPSGQGTPSASGLCPGEWSVRITDATGCDSTVTFTILAQVLIEANLTTTNANCAGSCDGTARVSPTGGLPPYTFQWSPAPPTGQGTDSAGGLCAGTWQVTVTDAAGCDTTVVFTITEPPLLVADLTTTPATCADPCSGTATVSVSGGTAPITILWQPAPGGGQGTTTATGLCGGSAYAVTVTDANGCDTTIAFTIDPFDEIIANSSTTPALCAGACDGTATVGPTGGRPPYTYSWSPEPGAGQGTPQATGLCAGTVTVTITDADGCVITENILILAPDPLDAGASVRNISCAALCDGRIDLAPQGGTAPYAYQWSPVPPNGQGGASATGLCAGTWSVTITDANGCVTTVPFTILEPLPLDAPVTVTPSECQVCVGIARVAPTGGTPPITMVWTDALGNVVGNMDSIVNVCAGIYTARVTDANGCEVLVTVPITDSDGEILTPVDGITNCPNSCDGAAGVLFTCADPPCVISWLDAVGNDLGESGDTVTGLCPGNYLVTVTNGTGCITIDTVTVAAPAPPVFNSSTSPASCPGACDGTATVGISGGVPPYIFTWSPEPGGGQGTPSATGLCAGTYTVRVGEASGCDSTITVLITAPQALSMGAMTRDVSCAGACDGNITLSPMGGTAPYAFIWSPVPLNGQGNGSAMGLCAGNWSVTVTDANGCQATDTWTIAEPAPLVLTGSVTPSSCPLCDGMATIDVAGGTAPYAINWTLGGNTVATGPSATGLCGGQYTATVTDANGCVAQLSLAVVDSDAEALTPIDGQVACATDCDGVVGVAFTCGAPVCAIVWTNTAGDTLATGVDNLTGLCPGDYIVQVTNGNGCVSIDTATVVPARSLVPNLSSTPASCNGACDGTATVGPTGGTAPYTFNWSPEPGGGQGTPQATGLCAGTWNVTITDSAGCDTTIAVLILEPTPLTIAGTVRDARCNGACDGSINARPQGGTAPYAFNWSPAPPSGQGTGVATGLCAGDWSVTVTDANGCVTTRTWTIAEPSPLTLATNSTRSECGVCDGTADATASGGTPGYTYLWTQGGNILGTNPAITGLCAGFYEVMVTDANGCRTTTTVPVSDLNGETTTTTDGLTTCPGDCDGVVTVDFQCGDPACVIAWFGAAGNDLNESGTSVGGLCAGMYFVRVVNATGCVTIDTAFVREPDPIIANLSTSPATCFGVCDGTATVGPTGGSTPYTYLWSPAPPVGQGTPRAEGLCAGNWTVTITDSLGCFLDQNVVVLEPALLTANVNSTDPACHGDCNGVITVAPQGGTQPYAFEWNPVPPNGQGGNEARDLCAGTWSVRITDGNGCDTTYTVTLVEPPPLDAGLATTDNQCFGECQGTARSNITGGVPGYTIVWLDGSGNTIAQGVDSIANLCAGNYTLSITDANGCELNVPFTITQGTAIEANLLWTDETCFGPCDGTAFVSPSGGTGPYTILWQPAPPVGQGTGQVSGLCAGNWSVTITDVLGCDTTYAFTLLPYTPISPNATVSHVRCAGDCDGSVVLAPTGGIGTYTYSWSPQPPNGQGNPEATGLCPGTISVTVTDAAGCDSVFTFTITEPPALNIVMDQSTDASCSNATDGSISTTVTGGTLPIILSWTGPGGFTSAQDDISGLAPGDYTLIVTDGNGCTATISVTVGALITVIADAGPDSEQCFGGTITLDGSGSTGAQTWTWTNAQGTVIGTTPILSTGPLPVGTHTFTLTVTNGPCTDTDQVTLTVLALPFADAGPNRTIFISGTTRLGGSPTGPPGSTFQWTPDSLLNNGTVADPIADPPRTTWFYLIVTAPNGCKSVDSVLVTVLPDIVIPDGFTPNGDGWNDNWRIDGMDLFPECEVEIYSRWGEMLFRSVGYRTPWDGRYNGGFVPVGTYYYVVKLNHPEFPEPYTGPLTVIR